MDGETIATGPWTDPMPGAASLVRGLLVLARSGRSGVLAVRNENVAAEVAVRDGRVVAMRVSPDDGDGLGQTLRAMNAWDEEAAMAAGAPAQGESLGGWGVRIGATGVEALSHALRKQLRRRIVRLFALDPPDLRLTPGSCDVGVPQLDEPPTTAELVVSALREQVAKEPLWSVRRRLGDGLLVLTPLGRELLEGAVLWPDEQAMLPALGQGAPVLEIVRAARGSARAQRLLHALRIVGAVATPAPRIGYATLLRKTRQVRRRANASELLDLPSGAPAVESRRALRRLARAVHPDRFTDASPAIRAASHQVMTALVQAQRDLG